MTILLSRKHIKCVEKGIRVSRDQTEQDCRDKYRCENEACPLRAYFLPRQLEELTRRNRTA